MCNSNKKRQLGSALEHGEAHTKDHLIKARRMFIKQMGLFGGMSMLLGKIPVSTLSDNRLNSALAQNNTDRILVLIRLKGGNDGLNTIIPLFDYGTYLNSRPTIAIPENQIIKLSDEIGVPPTMSPLGDLWQSGQMKVVHNVGYEDQNLSHFGSSDIWAAGNTVEGFQNSGWLGRWLEDRYPGFSESPPEIPPAIQIGSSGNLLFNNSEMTDMSVVVTDPQRLIEIAQSGEFYSTTEVPACQYGEQLRYARITANSTFRYGTVIGEAYERGKNDVEYDQNALANQLAVVARLIKGNLGTNLYMVSLDGFDTHARQNDIHPYLINSLASAVNQFYQDLSNTDWRDKVLSMSYSEFGRRIEQNASGGTDHGAAAPLLLFGEGLNGNGFVGENPNLQDVDDVGNLTFKIDFREIYATILEDWLCVDPSTVNDVLGMDYRNITELGLTCSALTSTSFANSTQIVHRVSYQSDGILVQYTLPHASRIKIELSNMAGQLIETLLDTNQYAGQQEIRIAKSSIPKGIYVYTIKTPTHQVSRKIMVN